MTEFTPLFSPDLPRLPRRALDAHKNSAGSVLVVAGSYGMAGAAYLAAAGALRSGAGYVRVACPENVYPMLAVLLPSVVFVPLQCSHVGVVLPAEAVKVLDAASMSCSVIIGPGLGREAPLAEFLASVISGISIPMVVDADALYALSQNPALRAHLSGEDVVTPHVGEAARLLETGPGQVHFYRQSAVLELSKLTGAVSVLKGSRTLVSDGKRIYENTSGNAGMAMAGCGDVLAGVIAAFRAQELDAFDSACLAVYLHGRAGDRQAAKKGRALLAEDIVEELPAAILAYERGFFEKGSP